MLCLAAACNTEPHVACRVWGIPLELPHLRGLGLRIVQLPHLSPRNMMKMEFWGAVAESFAYHGIDLRPAFSYYAPRKGLAAGERLSCTVLILCVCEFQMQETCCQDASLEDNCMSYDSEF